MQKIVETILQNREYAPGLLLAFALLVPAGAVLEILCQKTRYLLYQRKVLRLEDRLISACSGRGSGGREAFVLIQNTVDDFCAGQIDWVLECFGISGISILLGIYICSISARALLLTLAVTGGVLFLMWRGNQKIPDAAARSNEKMNAVYGEMWNYLKCKEILPFLQSGVYGKYEQKLKENQQAQILLGKYTNTARISMRFGSVGILLIAIVYFGMLTIRGEFTLAELFAVSMLLPGLAESMLRIPNCIAQYRKLGGIGRNLDAFLEKEGPKDEGKREPLGERITSIQVSDIKYSYRDGEVSCQAEAFSVQEGSSVGIFGDSGTGKTTLLRLILGELQITEGKCLVNGRETKTIEPQEFWSHILYLSQNPVILPVSLKENIVMTGNGSEIDEKKYLNALRKAGIEGLAAENGEREVDTGSLSSGEIQKICIARCFYTEKEVLILDEATNAMSPNAEKAVLKNLTDEAARKKKILILVSHNPAVIDLCEKAVRINRQGTDCRLGEV